MRALVAAMLGVVLIGSGATAQTAGRRGAARASTSPQVTPDQQAPDAADAASQGRPGRGGGRGAAPLPDPAAMGPNQVDQWFDTYLIFTAQTQLNLTDTQFLTFGQKIKNLQNIRRRVQKQRHETLIALRQMMQAPGPLDEAAVTERLHGLDDVSVQATPEIRQAYLEIDKLLNPRQRVRFRLFEEQMEQKKMELIALARQRQQGRSNQAPQGAVKK